MSAAITHEWNCWIIEGLMTGAEPSSLITQLLAHGFAPEAARHAVESRLDDPAIHVGRAIASRLKKTEVLLTTMQQLAQAIPDGAVDERDRIDAPSFFAEYYSRNRPLVLRQGVRHWPALYKWSPQYFAEHFGDAPIAITANRQADPWYELNSKRHVGETTMAELVAKICSGHTTNDYYLVANNYALQSPRLAPLFDDIGGIQGLLKEATRGNRTFMWFGPAGTVTPLHHDKTNLLIAQVMGRKRILMYPPSAIRHMRNVVGVFTAADPEDPGRSPIDLSAVPQLAVTLHPGDVLFVPIAWWHHVRALDVSITVSMDNFVFFNEFQIPDPYVYPSSA